MTAGIAKGCEFYVLGSNEGGDNNRTQSALTEWETGGAEEVGALTTAVESSRAVERRV